MFTHLTKYIKEKIIEIDKKDKSINIVGYFDAPLSVIYKSNRQNICKGVIVMNSTYSSSLNDIKGTLHPIREKLYILFKFIQETDQDISHIKCTYNPYYT